MFAVFEMAEDGCAGIARWDWQRNDWVWLEQNLRSYRLPSPGSSRIGPMLALELKSDRTIAYLGASDPASSVIKISLPAGLDDATFGSSPATWHGLRMVHNQCQLVSVASGDERVLRRFDLRERPGTRLIDWHKPEGPLWICYGGSDRASLRSFGDTSFVAPSGAEIADAQISPDFPWVTKSAGVEPYWHAINNKRSANELPDRTVEISVSDSAALCIAQSKGCGTRVWHRQRSGAESLLSEIQCRGEWIDHRRAPISIVAQDGLALPSVLRKGSRASYGSVILCHGGPWQSAGLKWDPLADWLVSQDMEVLSLNYRGSMGNGLGCLTAAEGQWPGAVVDDVIDAAIQLRNRTGHGPIVVGESFGAYLALMAVLRSGAAFAAAAAISPPVSLAAVRRGFPVAELRFEQSLLESELSRYEDLDRISPIGQPLGQIPPTLMIYDPDDARIAPETLTAFGRDLIKSSRHSQAIPLAGSGHDLLAGPRRRDAYALLLNFLRKANT